MKNLLMDVKVGESLSIDDGRVIVTLEEKSGQRIKLRFVHDDVNIEKRKLPAFERSTPTGAAQARMGTKLTA